MTWLAMIASAAAVGSWLYAVFHYVVAITKRQPEHSLLSFIVGGYKFFDADNFTDEGKLYQSKSLRGMAGFFLFIVLGIGLGLIADL